MDANDKARWETLVNDLEGTIVIGVSENRNNYRLVADIKVRVAGRQPCVPVSHVTRHWQLDDIQTETRQALIVIFQNFVVLIRGVVFECADDRVRIDKSRNVVDMAVGVVARDALAEPNEMTHAQRISEMLFDLAAVQMWISILIEKALFRG